MSNKRARYDGPYPSVDVPWADGTVTVERGHQLPADVPVSVRDGLLRQADWSEVKDTHVAPRGDEPAKPAGKEN